MSRNPIAAFRHDITRSAAARLMQSLPEDQARKAAARTGIAFEAAVQGAKDPAALMRCSPESVGRCVAMCALMDLYPGGAFPNVWLVPKGGSLEWWISHRGICELARRAGYQLTVVAAHVDEPIRLEFGEVVEHAGERSPASLEELRGVYVKIRRMSDGLILGVPWVSGDVIRARSSMRQAGPVWRQWPVEMAMKTALRFLMARGTLPVSSDDLTRALEAEPRVVDVEAEPARQAPPVAALLDLPVDDEEEGSDPKLLELNEAADWWTAMDERQRAKIAADAGIIGRAVTEDDVAALYSVQGGGE